MNKKNLQIQTNLDGSPQENQFCFPASQVLDSNKKNEGAAYLQKSLSCILARHFIECWETLKKYHKLGQTHMKLTITEQIKKRQNQGITLDVVQRKYQNRSFEKRYSQNRIKSRSQRHSQQCLYVDDEVKSFHRNKSSRSINPQFAYSRANALKQIVEKLKSRKRTNDEEMELEVMKKLNKLEKLLIQIRYKNNHVPPSTETKKQESTFVTEFTKQIEVIRKEINEIKKNNQFLINYESITKFQDHVIEENFHTHESEKNQIQLDKNTVFVNVPQYQQIRRPTNVIQQPYQQSYQQPYQQPQSQPYQQPYHQPQKPYQQPSQHPPVQIQRPRVISQRMSPNITISNQQIRSHQQNKTITTMPTFNTFNEIQNVRKPIEIQRHYRNPSIQMHEEVNAQRQMFCQSCGRSCNCARNAFSMIKKF